MLSCYLHRMIQICSRIRLDDHIRTLHVLSVPASAVFVCRFCVSDRRQHTRDDIKRSCDACRTNTTSQIKDPSLYVCISNSSPSSHRVFSYTFIAVLTPFATSHSTAVLTHNIALSSGHVELIVHTRVYMVWFETLPTRQCDNNAMSSCVTWKHGRRDNRTNKHTRKQKVDAFADVDATRAFCMLFTNRQTQITYVYNTLTTVYTNRGNGNW